MQARTIIYGRVEILVGGASGSYLPRTILSIILRGAKLGYCRPKQKIITGSLSSATNDPDTLTADLENQIAAAFYLLSLGPGSQIQRQVTQGPLSVSSLGSLIFHSSVKWDVSTNNHKSTVCHLAQSRRMQ